MVPWLSCIMRRWVLYSVCFSCCLDGKEFEFGIVAPGVSTGPQGRTFRREKWQIDWRLCGNLCYAGEIAG